jgi:hypothetical protein
VVPGGFGSGHSEPNRTPLQTAKQQAGIGDTQAKRWQKLAERAESKGPQLPRGKLGPRVLRRSLIQGSRLSVAGLLLSYPGGVHGFLPRGCGLTPPR